MLLHANENLQNSRHSMFSSITKSLRFEADEGENSGNSGGDSQQSGNDTGSSDESKDSQLDSDLNSLKEDGGEDDKSLSSDDPDNSGASQDGDSFGGDGFGGEGDGSSDGGSSSDGGGDTSSDDLQSNDAGKANRKLTLYTEYNRVYNSVKRSVESMLAIATDNPGIKACIPQLQQIMADMRFIMTDFGSRTEDDIMIHFTIIQKRIQVIMEQLSRIKDSESKDGETQTK